LAFIKRSTRFESRASE